jgi:hypothetical protein
MQIKAILRFHLTSQNGYHQKNQKHNTSGNNKEEKESLYTVSEYVN